MLIVTCAHIVKNGKILITQNGEDSDHAFQWEFPGGKIKLNETIEACIVREIKEELELDVYTEKALIPVEHDYGIKKIKLFPFICSIKQGQLKLNNHINAKWVGVPNLLEIDFSEADKKLLINDKNMQFLKEYTRK